MRPYTDIRLVEFPPRETTEDWDNLPWLRVEYGNYIEHSIPNVYVTIGPLMFYVAANWSWAKLRPWRIRK